MEESDQIEDETFEGAVSDREAMISSIDFSTIPLSNKNNSTSSSSSIKVYLGNQQAAHKEQLLKELEIGTIINCAPSQVENRFADWIVYRNVDLNRKGKE